ncbi:MAG: efflux RND transporter periplasmic adaptor subunit [Firmicutes bacterium]|nr:efflux RND transporter periplasmic adaptor subunit [Bacillota bacterium]
MKGKGTVNTKRKTGRWRTPLVILVLCAVSVAGYAWYRNNTERRKTVASGDLYQLVPVRNGAITLKITSSGTVKPGAVYQITPKLSSTITHVFVKMGDVVTKGQLLVALDKQDVLERLQEAGDNLAIAEAKLQEVENQAGLAPTQAKLQVEQAKVSLLNAEAKLAQLKEGAKSQDIDQAKIQVRQAQLNCDNAENEYNRYKTLFEQGAVTRQQLESAESKFLTSVESLKAAEQKLDLLLADPDPVELAAAEASVAQARTNLKVAEANEKSTNIEQQLLTARAQVAQARNSVSSAERNVSLANVVSPIDGTITEVSAQPGQTAGQSNALAVVTDLKHLNILANVDETDVHSIKAGQVADVMVESIPGTVFRGVVESVAEQGKVISGVVYFEVTVKVTDDSGALKSGMTADVDIIVDERSNVLVIPNAALESFRGLVMARVLDENKEPSFKRVQLGISDGTFTEVISGLEAGEMVAIPSSGTGTAGTVPARIREGERNPMMQFMPGGAMQRTIGSGRSGFSGGR